VIASKQKPIAEGTCCKRERYHLLPKKNPLEVAEAMFSPPEAAISEDYPQAYNVGTVGSQRCGPINSKEDGIPADGSLGNQLGKLCSLTMFDSCAR